MVVQVHDERSAHERKSGQHDDNHQVDSKQRDVVRAGGRQSFRHEQQKHKIGQNDGHAQGRLLPRPWRQDEQEQIQDPQHEARDDGVQDEVQRRAFQGDVEIQLTEHSSGVRQQFGFCLGGKDLPHPVVLLPHESRIGIDEFKTHLLSRRHPHFKQDAADLRVKGETPNIHWAVETDLASRTPPHCAVIENSHLETVIKCIVVHAPILIGHNKIRIPQCVARNYNFGESVKVVWVPGEVDVAPAGQHPEVAAKDLLPLVEVADEAEQQRHPHDDGVARVSDGSHPPVIVSEASTRSTQFTRGLMV